ncbi:MAG TPA: carbonate dehydratase [Steroidobacteraceae bacterium]|nr:carbonate dehydratase [Steroidobacteraceae bacterium]
MSDSGDLQALLARNRQWASGVTDADPMFFTRLAQQQTPRYLWIGCSDSRVPANQILNLLPGEIFVHRNVANVVVHSDLNCLSVVQFAVDVLKVRDIIVCGHYGCGGVAAALQDQKFGLIDNWLRHVQDVKHRHADQLDAAGEIDLQINRLCELNVIAQTTHLAESTIVQDAWGRGQPLAIHSLIYGLDDGMLRQLGQSLTTHAGLGAYKATAHQASPRLAKSRPTTT